MSGNDPPPPGQPPPAPPNYGSNYYSQQRYEYDGYGYPPQPGPPPPYPYGQQQQQHHGYRPPRWPGPPPPPQPRYPPPYPTKPMPSSQSSSSSQDAAAVPSQSASLPLDEIAGPDQQLQQQQRVAPKLPPLHADVVNVLEQYAQNDPSPSRETLALMAKDLNEDENVSFVRRTNRRAKEPPARSLDPPTAPRSRPGTSASHQMKAQCSKRVPQGPELMRWRVWDKARIGPFRSVTCRLAVRPFFVPRANLYLSVPLLCSPCAKYLDSFFIHFQSSDLLGTSSGSPTFLLAFGAAGMAVRIVGAPDSSGRRLLLQFMANMDLLYRTFLH